MQPGSPKTGAVPAKSTNGLSRAGEPRPEAAGPASTLVPVRRTIAAIGRTLVTLGLLILLFVAYQLWGTGIYTARAQEPLKHDFAKAQQAYRDDNPTVASTSPTTVRGVTTTTLSPIRKGPAPPTPPEGDVDGHHQDPAHRVDDGLRRGHCRATTSRRVPATTPTRPRPGRSATPRSPGTAPPICTRSTTSTRCSPATRSSSRRSTTRRSPTRWCRQLIVQPTDVVGRRQHARRRADAHELQPALLGRAAHRHAGRSSWRTRARSRRSRAPETGERRQGEAEPDTARRGALERDEERAARDRVGHRRARGRRCCGGGRSAAGVTRSRGWRA